MKGGPKMIEISSDVLGRIKSGLLHQMLLGNKTEDNNIIVKHLEI